MNTFVSVLCSLICLCSSSTGVVASISDFSKSEKAKAARTIELMNMEIEELAKEENNSLGADEFSDVELANISTVYSFSGSEYLLAEYQPSGYIIYDSESGTILESSVVVSSPYAYVEGTKYYGGPNEYYEEVEENGKTNYVHTIYQQQIENDDLVLYAEACTQLDLLLEANHNTAVLDFINNGPLNTQESVSPLSVKAGGFTYVKDYSFFKNLKNCGYSSINGGICGYIAAGMLLTYDAYVNALPVASPTMNISTSFPERLYNIGVSLGYGSSTTSVEIHYTVEKYLKNMGVTASHTSLYSPIASNMTIAKKIKNDRPVIWFGNITSNSEDSQKNINHAIVVYGYKYNFWKGYSYIAHFGWTGATSVTFTGIMGSMYTYEV